MPKRSLLPLLLLLPLLCAVPRASAQEPPPAELSLDEALRRGAEAHPALDQAQAELDSAEASVRQSEAALYPQLSASAGYDVGWRKTVPSSGFGGDAISGSLDFGLSAQQLLYDWGQTPARIDSTRYRYEAERVQRVLSERELAFGVELSYYQAQAALAAITVAELGVANQAEHLRQIEAFVSAELKPEIEAVLGRTDLAQAELRLVNAHNDYAAAKLGLVRAMGVVWEPSAFDVAAPTPSAPSADASDADTLVASALDSRQELIVLEQQHASAEASRDAAEASRWPRLTASIGLRDAIGQFEDMTLSVSAGIGLSWTLSDGGATQAEIDQAEAAIRQLDASTTAARNDIALEVLDASLQLEAAQSTLAALDPVETNAAEQLRLAEGRYAAGLGTVVELSDATYALDQVRSERVHAELALRIARAQLRYAAGE